jgi:hypothetical protein
MPWPQQRGDLAYRLFKYCADLMQTDPRLRLEATERSKPTKTHAFGDARPSVLEVPRSSQRTMRFGGSFLYVRPDGTSTDE